MFYAKFSRRHIASALCFFVVTMLLAGTVFLIYLFNTKSSLIVELRHDVVHNIQRAIGAGRLQNATWQEREATSLRRLWNAHNKSLLEHANKTMASSTAHDGNERISKPSNEQSTFQDNKKQRNSDTLRSEYGDFSDSAEPHDTIYIDEFEAIKTLGNNNVNRYGAQYAAAPVPLSKTMRYKTDNAAESRNNSQSSEFDVVSHVFMDELDDDAEVEDDEDFLLAGSGSGDYAGVHLTLNVFYDSAAEHKQFEKFSSETKRQRNKATHTHTKRKPKAKLQKLLKTQRTMLDNDGKKLTYQHQMELKTPKRTTNDKQHKQELPANATVRGSYSLRSNKAQASGIETKTRRVLGNFKKSEERSRQLLLCEEAGGGELCRMLFKDNAHD